MRLRRYEQWERALQKRRQRKFSVLKVLLRVLAGIIVISSITAGAYIYRVGSTVSAITSQEVPRRVDEPTRAATAPITLQSNRRINILLLGSDTDKKLEVANGNPLSQAMLVVTIDPPTKSVAILSIPRDFWVRIPDHGFGKIDTAFELGGVALARDTVERNFGIPIDYYAWVGLDGFVKVINRVNGIDIDVLHPVLDDTYPDDVNNSTSDIYAYKRLYIPAGPQHLNGEEVLEYVRSRHGDLIADFGRSQRQQQVLVQLKRKLENPAMVTQIPDLAHDLQNSVRTDMNLSQIILLARYAQGIPIQTINRVVLSPPLYSSNGKSDDNQDIVLPNWSAIQTVISKMFATSNANLVYGSDPAAVLKTLKTENAALTIWNGTPTLGLAGKLRDALDKQGLRVLNISAADRTDYTHTYVLLYNTRKGATAEYLAKILGTQVITNIPDGLPTTVPGADILVVIGSSTPELP